MKKLAMLAILLLAASSSVSAQGPGRVALSTPTVAMSASHLRPNAIVAPSGMTRSERGALIGGIIGVVAGAILSYSYDERSAGHMLIAGVIMAIPVSLIGSLIGML